MWCDSQFASFDSKLKLDKGRRDRIISAVTRFVDFCGRDDQLRVATSEPPFLQGSVATNTAIRPIGNDEYDVDVVYPFRLNAWSGPDQSPQAIFRWFVSRLKADGDYIGRMTVKNRCVRLNYAGDFHMDIIPSTREVPTHQPYAVPARDLMDWITNDPRGLSDWFKQRDRASGMPDADGDGVLVRGVRAMKRWRDQFFGSDPRPTSILLMTILAKHEASIKTYQPPLPDPLYPANRHDAAYLYDMLRLTHGCVQVPSSTPYSHPTIPGEDLRRGWDSAFEQLFLSRLAACIAHLRRGIEASTEAEAVRHYKAALGETFPSV